MRRITFIAITMALASASSVLRAAPSAPPAVHEVRVAAKQFSFEPAVIQVTAGEPIRLVVHSVDRGHGFSIRGLDIDVQVPGNGDVVVEFTAPRVGRYEIVCSEPCGSGHGRMKAALLSVAGTPTASR